LQPFQVASEKRRKGISSFYRVERVVVLCRYKAGRSLRDRTSGGLRRVPTSSVRTQAEGIQAWPKPHLPLQSSRKCRFPFCSVQPSWRYSRIEAGQVKAPAPSKEGARQKRGPRESTSPPIRRPTKADAGVGPLPRVPTSPSYAICQAVEVVVRKITKKIVVVCCQVDIK